MPDPAHTAYVILMNQLRPFTPEVILDHVEHLKRLDNKGQLVLCGPFDDYQGGMVVVRARSKDEARQIAESDPFIREGFEQYELRTLELACKENSYLMA